MFNLKCPYCGKDMDEGFVRGLSHQIHYNSSLYWNDENHKMGWFSNGLKLFSDHHNFGCPAVKAYKCDDCKKIIMETYIVEDK